MRSTASGAMIAHSSTCIAPIEPPSTAAKRSIPSLARERDLRAHLVADREEREPRAPLDAVGRERGGTGRALASADHVGGDDEVAVGVDREPGADDARPPARARMRRAGGADDVAVAREGVQHEDRVVARGRERAPRLVGDAGAGQGGTGVEGHVADRHEAAVADRVALAPGPGRGRATLQRLRARLRDDARGHRVGGGLPVHVSILPNPRGGHPFVTRVTTAHETTDAASPCGPRHPSIVGGVRRARPPWRRARRRGRPRGRPSGRRRSRCPPRAARGPA